VLIKIIKSTVDEGFDVPAFYVLNAWNGFDLSTISFNESLHKLSLKL
jgi:hypothetical protein